MLILNISIKTFVLPRTYLSSGWRSSSRRVRLYEKFFVKKIRLRFSAPSDRPQAYTGKNPGMDRPTDS